jgi:hypothetical protein
VTLDELRAALHHHKYPPTFPVDPDTWDRAYQAVKDNLRARGLPPIPFCGPNGGVMFKGVELLDRTEAK